MGIFPNFRDENKKYLKLPPSILFACKTPVSCIYIKSSYIIPYQVRLGPSRKQGESGVSYHQGLTVEQTTILGIRFPKDPFVSPKKKVFPLSNPMTWGWECFDHPSYDFREGSGFLGIGINNYFGELTLWHQPSHMEAMVLHQCFFISNEVSSMKCNTLGVFLANGYVLNKNIIIYHYIILYLGFKTY